MDRIKENAPTVSTTAGGNSSYISKTTNNIIPDMPQKVKAFRCNIDTVAYQSKDEAKKKTGAIVNRTKSENRIMELTPDILSEAVTHGFSFTTAALKGTTEKDFISQQLLVLDNDNEREDIAITTVEDAIKILTENDIEYSFIYYSFSHSTILPKFRIVCVLSEPITDPAQAKRLNQYFISLFPQADASCFNLDRFYYGTDKGLATEVYDRTTTITVPADWQLELPSELLPPEQEQKSDVAPSTNEDAPPISANEATAKPQNGDNFDLTQAIRNFNLISYIEQTTGTQSKQHGKDVLFNPCPICGHKDDFYVDPKKNLFKCHSSSNGKGGNIINYIEQKNPEFDRKTAREYFIYEVLKRDRNAAYKKTKKAEGKNTEGEEAEEQYGEITIAGVEKHLKIIGVTAKYNKITRKVDIKGLDPKHSREHMTDNLPILVYNKLKQIYNNCAKGDIQDFLNVISTDNAYNPVIEMLDGGKWDGVDRLLELYRIMRIEDSDRLSKLLIYKWLWQCLSMARNEFDGAYGADGLLVLQGAQGTGKTTLVRKLSVRQEFCLIGKSLNFQDKDTLRRCASAWIVELGEIETTFRSDKEKLKAFITDEIDMYRLPYGRTDVELARRTSLIGTCNSTEYLIDETGNRRFWTIPVKERMDLDALEKFDALQLWLQIDSKTKHNRQGFRLNIDEQNALNERNGQHEKPLKGEIEVKDIIAKRCDDSRYMIKEVTVTEFKMSEKALEKFDSREIGRVLDKMGMEAKRKKVNGKVVSIRTLPMAGEDFKKWVRVDNLD